MEAARLGELIIGKCDEKYLDVKYKEVKERNNKELEDINRTLKELSYFYYCDKKKDDICEHHWCVYSVLCFGKEYKVICGRRDK